MYFHAWESGTGCYDCEKPLSRRFGPDGERFAVYAQFWNQRRLDAALTWP